MSMPKTVKLAAAIVLFGIALAIWLPQWIRFAGPGRSDTTAGTAPSPAPDTLQQLAALGYLPFVEIGEGEPERGGVTVHEPDRVSDGVNIVFPEFGCKEIQFQDMSGEILHRIDVSQFPNHECYSLKPTPDGFLFLAAPNLFKFDDRGKLEWEMVDGRMYHHDFDEFEGKVVALTQKWGSIELDGKRRRVKRNPLVVIEGAGVPVKEISLLELFLEPIVELGRARGIDPFAPSAVNEIGLDYAGDLLHANSVQILRRDSAIGEKGDVLVSLRSIDTIAVIDLDVPRVVWSWGPGVLDHQHHPTLLDNGNLLVFDNGYKRGYSRVIELEPESKTIVWQFGGADASFYTQKRGGAYALPNGNVLVTESDHGRAFEVTRSGEAVWEYWMDTVEGERRRNTVYRIQRMPRAEFERRFGAQREAAASASREAEEDAS
jgi:hypothetical protein